MESPLVSCIMPTYNRREFVPLAIRYFLRQDYENKELIIIDDGTDSVRDIIPEIENIHYYSLDNKISLGAKLNMACEYAKGNILINWDDDDWYASRRITYQTVALQYNQTAVCGINKLLYYDLIHHQSHCYVYPPGQRTWLLGSSLCFTRNLWNINKFADINVGMDALFVWGTPANQVSVLPDSTISVHMIHDHNVSPKKTNGSWWQRFSNDEVQKIMDSDWEFYNSSSTIQPERHSLFGFNHSVKSELKTLKNVYACLVHENADCIIDLVRNLHYHDPESVILLYNGGQNPNLLKGPFPYEKFGVVRYPTPIPVKWGELHQFALDCMDFALKNFSADILTVVDSDQLLLKNNYTQHVSNFLNLKNNIGMLSNMPEHITIDHTHIHPSVQAFKEYDLWKPFIQHFKDGESKFLHWTFWPSTVFTADAMNAMVNLFKTNAQLKDIMMKSRIWATEEVVLPTIVALLGFEITTNPCSYEFVNYKKSYSLEDIKNALHHTNAYWIHPVERRYDNPLRKMIRQHTGHYLEHAYDHSPVNQNSKPMLSLLSSLNSIKQIQGWLDEEEADLLLSVTLKACIELPGPHSIVEIGSFQGKSTVLLGSILKAFFPTSKVYAIDPHDGVVGSTDQGIQTLPATLESFKKNICAYELAEVVEPIIEYSFNVHWERSISLLFIDGLHDYPNVARDFYHFSMWIHQNGYIAFHDYAPYYPGVMAFVDELLSSKNYLQISKANSLIILQKL